MDVDSLEARLFHLPAANSQSSMSCVISSKLPIFASLMQQQTLRDVNATFHYDSACDVTYT